MIPDDDPHRDEPVAVFRATDDRVHALWALLAAFVMGVLAIAAFTWAYRSAERLPEPSQPIPCAERADVT